MVDITLVRDVLAELTRGLDGKYHPGGNRRAFRCPHCRGIYTAAGVRVHIPRCDDNPRLKRKTYAETAFGALRVSRRELIELFKLNEWLSDGSQGAD